MSDDFDPILEMVAAALRPAPGILPDQPSDDELAALRDVVARRFPNDGRRDFEIRRRLPTAIAAVAAATLISTASVAAAATSVGEPVRLAKTIANEIGLPVTDPNLDDARSTLRALTATIQRNDVRAVAGQTKRLRTELGRLDSNDRNKLMQQIVAKSPAIAALVSNGAAWAGGPIPAASGPTSSTDSDSTLARRRARTQKSYRTKKGATTETGTTIRPDPTPTTNPGTTEPPDATPSTDPGTTIPPDTGTTTPPGTSTTIPADTSTTIPPDTSTTTPPTSVPGDTTTTTAPPPTTTTSSWP